MHPNRPAYAVLTSRCYHSGQLVQAVMVGGSVHAFTSGIDLQIWRALGDRDDGRAIGEF